MKQTIVMTTMLLAAQAVMAEPELSGTPSDLTQHLSGLPGQVTISGSAESVTFSPPAARLGTAMSVS